MNDQVNARAATAAQGVAAPALAILGSLVSVNAGAAWAKGLFPAVGSAGVVALRVGLSALILLAIVRPWRFPLRRADLPNLVIYGVMLGAMNLFIYRSFERIPLGIAVAIEVTGPLAVVILSSRHARDFLWVILAGAGLWLLLPTAANSAALDPVGIAYALAAAFCWAMYIVFGKRVSTLDGGQAVSWGLLAACVFVVPFGVSYAGGDLLAPAVLGGGLAVAILSSALPYTLEMKALKRLPRRVFGILVSAGPAVAALAGFLLLGERLTTVQWLAIAMVTLACAGAAATADRR
ncbi:EamA family transporter [Massilia timonae]|uniref:EamA-like transporter family protein n=1 Tax=Massilia timonae TaxID=47229 RepID=A0A1S2N6B6_9BURK|nr:EamA family transporter [Massilia timonae]OIJ40443.1 eamA-like transporter family protein [Massilia timonae]